MGVRAAPGPSAVSFQNRFPGSEWSTLDETSKLEVRLAPELSVWITHDQHHHWNFLNVGVRDLNKLQGLVGGLLGSDDPASVSPETECLQLYATTNSSSQRSLSSVVIDR